MGAIRTAADTVFRDYRIAGNSASRAHTPVKSEIRALFGTVEDNAGTGGGGGVDISDRPGLTPARFTNTANGGASEGLSPLSDGLVVVDDRGAVIRLTGASAVAQRYYTALELGRDYRVRAVVQRRVNTPDPAGDAVRVAVAWYDRNLAQLSTTTIYDLTDLTTGDGRTMVEAVVAMSAGDGVDYVAPGAAVYFRAFIVTFGTLHQTDVEVLATGDISDLAAWSPDVSGLDARVGALESIDAGDRLDVLETEVGNPGMLTFPTHGDFLAATIGGTVDGVTTLGGTDMFDGDGKRWLRATSMTGTVQSADGAWWKQVMDSELVEEFVTIADAEAATVPNSVSILRIFSKTLPDFPVDAAYREVTGSDYDIQTADGKKFQVIGPRYDLAAFGVNGGNDPTDDAKIQRAFDRVRPGAVLEIPAAAFRGQSIARSDIYVRGARVPRVASDGNSLVGGSRWLGRFAIDGDDLILEDFGADAGATFLGAGAATDAINVRAADNFTAGTIRKNIKARNLLGLCKNNTSGVHGILLEGLDDVEIEGMKTYRGLFGTVVKATNGFVRNTRAREYGQAGLTIKSDHYAACGAIDVDGVIGQTTAAADGLLAVHAATASLSRWSARGVNALGGKRAVILIGSRRPSGSPVPYDPGPPEVQGTFPYCALSDFIISDVFGLGYTFRGFETYGALFNGRIRGIQMNSTVGTGTIGFYTDEHTLDLDIEDVTVNGPSYNAAAVRLGGYFRARNITSLVGNMGTANGINRVYLGGDPAVSVVTPYFGTLTG